MKTCSVLRHFVVVAALVSPAFGQQAAQAPPRVNTRSGQLSADVLRNVRFRLIGHANTSGRVTAIDVANTPGRRTIYVGFASGGVWKSTNNGTTWTPIFDDAAFTNVSEVAISSSQPDIVWVGLGERNSLRSQGWGAGLYKSSDGGRTWKQSGLTENTQIGRIAIHPRNPDIVYAAAMGDLWGASTARGVYKTTDGGNTWQKILFANDTVAFVDIKMDPSNPEVLYAAGWHRLRRGGGTMEGAGAGSGIWKTADGGRTWRKLTDPALNNGLPTEAMGRIGLAIAPKNPRIVYAVIQVARSSLGPTVSAQGGVFRSDDGGARWTRVNDISALPDYFYNEVYVDPNNSERVYINSVQLSVSNDGGKSFAPIEMNRVHVDHHALWIDPDDSKHMLLGNDGGVHVTYDSGETWEHLYHPVGQFYEVNIDSTKTPYHVCGGLQDNGVWCGPSRTRDRAGITNVDWYAVFGGDGFHSAVSPDSPQYRFAESQFANVSRCNTLTNRCETIRPTAEDAGVEAGREFRWDWNTPFFISRYDPRMLYLGANYLFRLTDRGRQWQVISPELTRFSLANPEPDTGWTSYHSLHSIAESPRDRNVLWAGTNDGLIWITQDGGRNWRNVTANIPDAAAQRCVVAEIDASNFDVRTAYVAYDCHQRNDYRPYIYRTTDAGASFHNISGDLPTDAGSWVVREDHVNPRLLFAGNERGLYMSTQGGTQWLRLKNNLPTVSIRDVDLMPRERELVVGTFGRSIYILDLIPLQELTDSVIAQEAHLFTVRDAQLYQQGNTYESYADKFFTAPNPALGAPISYYIKNDIGRDVTLTVRRAGAPESDVVQTLTGSGRPGINTVTWDLLARRARPRELGGPTNPQELREVPEGSYTVSMRIGNNTLTRTFRVTHGWRESTPGRVR
jgi:photosystem II stability/assembly factor-like uncharacterized protein